MTLKAAEIYGQMDKLIDTYRTVGNTTRVLRIPREWWDTLSRDADIALKKNIWNHPVQIVQGKPHYKRNDTDYTLLRA